MLLRQILAPDACIVVPRVVSRDELLQLLVGALTAGGERGLSSAERVLEELIRREEAASTAFGFGVAVPHCFLPGVGAPRLAVASCPAGVDWSAMDGELTLLVFLLIEDLRERAAHNALLARIARLCRETSILSRLRDAERAADFPAILAEEEARLRSAP